MISLVVCLLQPLERDKRGYRVPCLSSELLGKLDLGWLMLAIEFLVN
jgi:hypothetical protein